MAKFLPNNTIKMRVLEEKDGQKYGRTYEASSVELHNADGYNPMLTARLIPHAEYAEWFDGEYKNIAAQKEETVTNTYVTDPVHDAALKAIKERLDIMQQEGLKRRRELQALVRKQETEREESEERLMTVLLEAQQAGLDLRRVDAVFPVEFDFIKEFWDSMQYFSDLTFKEDEE